jgi:membrane protein YqaA with SNARE-associated domain
MQPKEKEEESKSSFLVKNIIRGLLWFAVIITIFILAEDYIQTNFRKDIEVIHDRPVPLYMIFFASEVIFGLIPPEFFMLVWILHGVSIPQYVINLTILTLISYLAGIIGYFIGKNLSKTHLYNRIYERYLQAYEGKLKKYGGFLVIVGATTPVPYSATCMLAGSINLPFRYFLVICITRIVRFSVYGWMVWKFPVWFS